MSHLDALLTATAVFAATNVDDLVVLSAFFADPKMPPRSVVAGQFLGIGALVLVSILAGLASVAVPDGWPAVLGLAPLGLGLWKGWQLLRTRRGGGDDANDATPPVGTSPVLAVAAVTIANGGDNLAVYIPLLAANRSSMASYVGVFTALTAVWCALGFALVKNRVFGARIQRYGHVALPFVLIGLGVHILSGARTLLR